MHIDNLVNEKPADTYIKDITFYLGLTITIFVYTLFCCIQYQHYFIYRRQFC